MNTRQLSYNENSLNTCPSQNISFKRISLQGLPLLPILLPHLPSLTLTSLCCNYCGLLGDGSSLSFLPLPLGLQTALKFRWHLRNRHNTRVKQSGVCGVPASGRVCELPQPASLHIMLPSSWIPFNTLYRIQCWIMTCLQHSPYQNSWTRATFLWTLQDTSVMIVVYTVVLLLIFSEFKLQFCTCTIKLECFGAMLCTCLVFDIITPSSHFKTWQFCFEDS